MESLLQEKNSRILIKQCRNEPAPSSGKKVVKALLNKNHFMKRLLYGTGIVLSLGFLGSCAQHDTESPDTSGAVPYGEASGRNTTGVDTFTNPYPNDTLPNMNNDGTNATKQSSTFDSVEKRQ